MPLNKRIQIILLLCALGVSNLMAYEKIEHGIELQLPQAQLRLELVTSAIFHIRIVPGRSFSTRPSLAVVKSLEKVPFLITDTDSLLSVQSGRAKATLDLVRGEIAFRDETGRILVRADGPDASSFLPVSPDGESAFQLRQRFHFPGEDGLYGLGQFEDGLLDFRGQEILLAQANRVAINPFLVSGQGCGILWENYSVSKFKDDADGTSFTSEAGDQIDYYVVMGQTMDQAIAGYRTLTGAAPLFPKWAYGFFQSKERYKSADELIGVVQEHRKRRIPLDVIVQDWAYWGSQDQFSGMVWSPENYPDPAGMSKRIHELNARLMVSIWPAFGPASAIYQEMAAKDHLYPGPHWSGSRVYDAYSKEARDIYWRHVKSALFDQGVDAYWMDGTEPEFRCTDDRYITASSMKANGKSALGSLTRLANPYSLFTTRGVYEGQRALTDDKRVFILTRSAFSGQQRHAAVTWSGDTFAGWQVFQNQITAGLTFCMSGIPYWTADIGGFLTANLFPQGVADPAYKELYVRWFQYGAFCPIFRSHGTNTPREMWQFGEPGQWAYDALMRADKLRYRLLPYIYSQAWRITNEGYTLMRGMPMDFPGDTLAMDLGHQFMFGPAMLVCPVTRPMRHPPADQAEAIPGYRLFGTDKQEPGLDLSLYRDPQFQDQMLRRKLDLSSIGWFGCIPGELDSAYSARVSGHLLSAGAGTYSFSLSTDGSIRFWLDNKLVIDAWDNRQPNTFSLQIPLQAEFKYAIQIDHQQFKPMQANLRLNWLAPATPQPEGQISIYLPTHQGWYDFWTGTPQKQTGTQAVPAPIDQIPLFVQAGTILPLGPELQFSGEKPANPLEIRIYQGKDAQFTLYEDRNDGYAYERGEYATIEMRWEEGTKKLTVAERKGSFPGMLQERSFRVVLVRSGHGAGLEETADPDQIIQYTGAITVTKL